MRAVLALALFGLAAVSAVNTFGVNSFCERYTVALFTTNNAANQASLISAVVGRALSGNTTVTTPAVRGILNNPWEMKYFNGTGGFPTNFYTDATARTDLIAKLNNFFAFALGCRAMTTTTPSNQKTVHQSMSISKRVWDEFIGELGATLTSFGVAQVDIVFAVNLLNQFNRGLGMEICNAADCDVATPIKEFYVGSDGTSPQWFGADLTSTVTIAPGGWIHWNFGASHNVRQTDANYAAMAAGTGFGSGAAAAGVASYNWQVPATPTDTTYYFICEVHPTTMRGKIVVGNGGLSGASSLTASVAVVLSAIAAAVALRF